MEATKQADRQGGAADGEEADSVASASAADSSVEGLEKNIVPPSTELGAHAVALPNIPSRTDEHIRRSARKQFPVDRLVFEARKPREAGSATRIKRERREALVTTSTTAVETSDSMSDSSEASDAADTLSPSLSSCSTSFSSSSPSSSSSAASPAPPPSSSDKSKKRCRYQAVMRVVRV